MKAPVRRSKTSFTVTRMPVQPFYRWLASWAIALRKPSDIGYDDTGYILPPLRIHEHVIEGSGDGESLFPELGLKGIGGRQKARRGIQPRGTPARLR